MEEDVPLEPVPIQPAPRRSVPRQSVPLVAVAPQTSGLAIASLVTACLSILCLPILGPLSIILGIIALVGIKRSGGQLKGDGLAIGGIVTGAILTFLIMPALLLPAIQAAREAARRNVTINNMKQISLALQIFADTHRGAFPAAKNERGSQLSWRVHILPYLEEQALYEQFHLDEPWDSPHNRTLIEKMPAVFENPSGYFAPGETAFLAVTGPDTAFDDGETAPAVEDFLDGMSNTVFFVEADHAVVWTKPDDWQFDPNNPARGLGHLHPGGFLAAFGDIAVRFINNDTPLEVVKSMMTRDGREQIDMRRQLNQ